MAPAGEADGARGRPWRSVAAALLAEEGEPLKTWGTLAFCRAARIDTEGVRGRSFRRWGMCRVL